MLPIFKAVIFDLDGVLVDTAEFHYQAWKRRMDEIDLPFDRKKNERLKGVSRMQSLEILLGNNAVSSEEMEALAENKNRYYVEMIKGITPCDLFGKVEELLKWLKTRHIKIGIASASKNAKMVIANLGIEEMVDCIMDGYDFKRGKPDPEIFLLCAERLGVNASTCIVVEDAKVGIEAARRAGMFSVGIGNPLLLSGANCVVNSIKELKIVLSLPLTA